VPEPYLNEGGQSLQRKDLSVGMTVSGLSSLNLKSLDYKAKQDVKSNLNQLADLKLCRDEKNLLHSLHDLRVSRQTSDAFQIVESMSARIVGVEVFM